MKSNTQQVVSIFLVVCLFIFFGVGIASDGFSDFKVFEPKPIAPSIATAEVEDCSSEVVQSDTIDRITCENERVEYGFTLVSGDKDSDTGFSISDEGILTFTSFEYALSKFDYDYLSDYEGQGYVSSTLLLEIGLSSSSSTSFRSLSFTRSSFEATGGSIDLVREICRRYTYVENLSFNSVHIYFGVSLYKENHSALNTSFVFGNVSYRGYVNFFDRVDPRELYVKPNIEEGYIFDGWYTDSGFTNTSYYGSSTPNPFPKNYFYVDAIIDLYPKVSPAVTVSIDFGDSIETIQCAVGTSSLTSRSISRSNLMSLFRKHCHSGDKFCSDGIVITSDMVMFGGTESIVDFVIEYDMIFTYEPILTEVTIIFYDGEEIFYASTIPYKSNLDLDLIPLPKKPGYDFREWTLVSDGSLFKGGVISENTSVKANFDLHYYTVTLNFPEGYATESGRTSFSETGVSHLTNSYYHFPYGDVFELKGSDGLLYKTDGWITEDGAEYDFCSPIYADLNLYAKVVRLRYKVSYWYKDKPSAYAVKIVEYYPGELVDYVRDTVEFQKPGYLMTLFVSGSGVTAEEYFEYDYSPVNSTVYLYMKFTIIEYTIKFHSDYKLSFDNVTCTCEDNLTLPDVETRVGYDFLGWYYKDGSVFEENTVILSDLDLYDKWQIQRKKITLMTDGLLEWSFNVDYGTSLEDVLTIINKKNYNVVSFTSVNFREDQCFIGDTTFEVQAMDNTDSIKNTIKNKWQTIVVVIVGVFLFVGIVSIIPKSKRRKR